jgi:hypothetical protein
MAENKNTFVFYAEWKQDFEFLTNDEAGKLIKHLLQYVNDENPEFENEDRLLQFAAQKLKNVLKKDLKKYEEVCKKRSEAGKKGGVTSGKSRALKQDKPNEANASIAKQNERDNEYDNEYDNDILLVKESKHVEEVADDLEKISDLKLLLKTKKQIQMDRLRMTHKLSVQDLELKIDEFIEKKVSWDDDNWRNDGDMARNFEFWLLKNPKPINNYRQWNKAEFWEKVKNIQGTVKEETKRNFFDHYSMLSENGKMRFQNLDAWETKTMLKKWLNNQKQFAK